MKISLFFLVALYVGLACGAPVIEIGDSSSMTYSQCRAECEQVEGYRCENIGASFACIGPPGNYNSNTDRHYVRDRAGSTSRVQNHGRGTASNISNDQSHIDDPCNYESSVECEGTPQNDASKQ